MVPAWTETCPWGWFLREPRHVGAVFYIFIVFNDLIFYTSECISWIIQWLIILLHGVIMKNVKKISQRRTGHRRHYVASVLHTGHTGLNTHTHNVYSLLFFHCNNGCTKAPQCDVVCTLPVLSFTRMIYDTYCTIYKDETAKTWQSKNRRTLL